MGAVVDAVVDAVAAVAEVGAEALHKSLGAGIFTPIAQLEKNISKDETRENSIKIKIPSAPLKGSPALLGGINPTAGNKSKTTPRAPPLALRLVVPPLELQ